MARIVKVTKPKVTGLSASGTEPQLRAFRSRRLPIATRVDVGCVTGHSGHLRLLRWQGKTSILALRCVVTFWVSNLPIALRIVVGPATPRIRSIPFTLASHSSKSKTAHLISGWKNNHETSNGRLRSHIFWRLGSSYT
jgi:hypothetical protein